MAIRLSDDARFRKRLPPPLAVLLACAAFPVVLAAQVYSGPGAEVRGGFAQLPAQTSTTKYKVTGTVVNSVTGIPIGRVLVQATGMSSSMSQTAVLTDASGQFEFEAQGGATLSLLARKPGYFTEQEVTRKLRASRSSFLQVKPDLEPVVLKLVPEAMFEGRVTGADGEPVESAQVRLYTTQIVNGRKQRQHAGNASTDEDGTYRVGGLRPGSYLVAVGMARSGMAEPISANQTHATGYPLEWFFPGVPERNAAGLVELMPGQESECDFAPPRQPVFRIAATLIRPAGVGVGVQLLSTQGEPMNVPTQLRPDGHFEMRQVPRGTYMLQTNAGDQQGHQYFARVQMNVASDVNSVVLAPEMPPSIPVIVRTEFNKPHPELYGPRQFCSQGTCSSTPPPGYVPPPIVQVQLRGLDPPYWSAMSQPDLPGSSDLVVRNVWPGRYAVEIMQSQFYVKSAMAGNVDLLREPLVVAPGAQIPPISVVLRDDSGTLVLSPSGTVPESGAQVLMFSDTAPMQTPRTLYLSPPAPPGSSATFVFRGAGNLRGRIRQPVAPGDYTLLAFDQADGLEYANPEVMKKYLPRATHATVNADGETTVSVEVIQVRE